MLYCDTYLLISCYHIGFSATYAVFFGMTSSVSPRALGFNIGINITNLIFSGELPNIICNNI